MALPAKTVLCNASRLSGRRERITIQHESVPFCKRFQVRAGRRKGRPPQDRRRPLLRAGGRDMSGMFLANLLTCLGFLPVICLVYIGFLMNSLPSWCSVPLWAASWPVRCWQACTTPSCALCAMSRLLVDHLPQGFQAELQSQHPAGRALLRRGHGAGLPRVFLLQPALPRHQRRRRHVGGHGAQPRHLPHAVLLHVASGGPAGPAFRARRSRTASTA
mgnify:CR=1 FL=1